MADFKRRTIHKHDILDNDKGVLVSEILKLIDSSDYYNDIIGFFNIDINNDEFIAIPGASTLLRSQEQLKSSFIKEDINCYINEINLINEEVFSFEFTNTVKKIQAEPIYSAKRDFFSELFNMDKYAASLMSGGHFDIINQNYLLLKEIYDKQRKYRILYQKDTNKYFLRAITSTGSYNNYDNYFAVAIALLTLNKDMQENNNKYSVSSCEYNESIIRMFFELDETKDLHGIGYVKQIIEVSNNELKQGALNFFGVNSVNYTNSNDVEDELFIRAKDVKSKIFGINHNLSPKKAFIQLNQIVYSEEVLSELYNDTKKISTITKPDEVKFILQEKVKKATSEKIKNIKESLLKELNVKVNNIIQLLEIFNKLHLVANEDIEAKEFLRYEMYNALINRK